MRRIESLSIGATVQPAELLQDKVAVQSGLCMHCTDRMKV